MTLVSQTVVKAIKSYMYCKIHLFVINASTYNMCAPTKMTKWVGSGIVCSETFVLTISQVNSDFPGNGSVLVPSLRNTVMIARILLK